MIGFEKLDFFQGCSCFCDRKVGQIKYPRLCKDFLGWRRVREFFVCLFVGLLIHNIHTVLCSRTVEFILWH